MVQGMGKYTVITGASSGIGYEVAKAFAERGKNLVIAARRKNNLEKLKREILGYTRIWILSSEAPIYLCRKTHISFMKV